MKTSHKNLTREVTSARPKVNQEFSCCFIEDITPPKLTFVIAPYRSGDDVKITWTANENVTAQCTLQTPAQITAQPCNMSWTGTNLSEGFYSIYVQLTDLAGNTASPARHSWFVGKSLMHILSNMKLQSIFENGSPKIVFIKEP